MSLRSMFANPLTVELARKFRNVFIGRDWNGFHRDRIYRALMLEVLQALPVTSFVETGTWRGDSTQTIAMRYPKLPIFTSEVVEKSFNLSRAVLRRYPNVTQDLGSSDQFIARLIAEKRIGDLPFFFLDAHWHTYWPLRAELKHISDAKLRCVMVIDDFEVPGQPQFGFDIDGGGELKEGLKCNLDYIRPSLGAANSYRVLFPKYGMADAYPQGSNLDLRGHIAVFQNLDGEFEAIRQRELLQKHYFVGTV